MYFFRHRYKKCRSMHQQCCNDPQTCQNGNTIYDYPQGKKVQIIAIHCQKHCRCQLISMGFIPGTVLTILENTLYKTCLVSIDNRKITLDQQTALSLIVKPM